MCAIFGWFGSDQVEKLHTMATTMRHRGPDGEGYLHSKSAAIGMTRLAIIDLSNGQQPFYTNDKEIAVVCNGEIYNFVELKQELIALGHSFTTQSDCEILPAAYQQWGIQFLQKLNGMFAIAIYDRKNKQLTLARDRCGQKPLYYARHDEKIYFSSEIRALHQIGIPKALNLSAIPAYLSLRYVPEPETMFQHIQILPAGSFLTIDNATQHTKPEKWYSVRSNKVSHTDPQQELHQLGFGASSDEVKEAAALCKRYDIPHTAVTLTENDISSLPQVISQMELPVGDALILAFDKLAEATKSSGAKVAIGGEGVDELFAGYSFHKFMVLSEKLGKLGRSCAAKSLALAPNFLLDKISAFPASLGVSGKQKIHDYLSQYDQLNSYEKGINLRTLFSNQEIFNIHSTPLKQQPFPKGGDILDHHLEHQFLSWMQDWAIIRQERNTMAHSIEYRMPFLDHRLIEFAFSLENEHKLSGRSGKAIWRQMAARFYPETQHKRTKQPFFFPTEEHNYWSEITKLLDSTIGSETFRKRDLFSLEYIKDLRTRAEQTREFLPIKSLSH